MLDTFFGMGGNSLSAVQLSNRIRGMFRVEMPLYLFFENSTIREMATVIAELQQHNLDSKLRKQDHVGLTVCQYFKCRVPNRGICLSRC